MKVPGDFGIFLFWWWSCGCFDGGHALRCYLSLDGCRKDGHEIGHERWSHEKMLIPLAAYMIVLHVFPLVNPRHSRGNTVKLHTYALRPPLKHVLDSNKAGPPTPTRSFRVHSSSRLHRAQAASFPGDGATDFSLLVPRFDRVC